MTKGVRVAALQAVFEEFSAYLRVLSEKSAILSLSRSYAFHVTGAISKLAFEVAYLVRVCSG